MGNSTPVQIAQSCVPLVEIRDAGSRVCAVTRGEDISGKNKKPP
eukprot:SAG11_NODE_45059_length_148_cov_98.040816_1_plen_43_part_01